MTDVKLLDCTLRDGMYVTDFKMDDEAKIPVVRALEKSGVEITELGFLKNVPQAPNSAVYAAVGALDALIPPRKNGRLYAAIIMSLDEAPDLSARTETSVDCLRIAFFKKDADRALAFAASVKAKGYEVMLQPMRTSDYSDDEIRRLIDKTNRFRPYSFAIVDSFGNMLPSDVDRLSAVYAAELDTVVSVGFHFHNNLQLAFANALTVLDRKWKHSVILDCSVFGMGRGAGNLPTELIADRLNRGQDKKYLVQPVFDIYARYFKVVYDETPWGYSHRHFVSATHNVNPFYATYLTNTYGFSASALEAIFAEMPEACKTSFAKTAADEFAEKHRMKAERA